jgi:hypothetical protein
MQGCQICRLGPVKTGRRRTGAVTCKSIQLPQVKKYFCGKQPNAKSLALVGNVDSLQIRRRLSGDFQPMRDGRNGRSNRVKWLD